MTAPRRLAYKNQPGHVYSEADWVKSRQWLVGESESTAKAAIQKKIDAGEITVVQTET